ncbi:hypothetical protein GPX89_40315 [Nocardia sp. ET3-3]|uniref:Uncharacterized protein n=1 Tax=Nocardia terrae TaxID=2675851 RepID=A0A7K1V9Y7_9NOCA|nr:hypothetical protein [Nocardia terrae]MVU83470.1 hypothetical protein [Nocardia terrae]
MGNDPLRSMLGGLADKAVFSLADIFGVGEGVSVPEDGADSAEGAPGEGLEAFSTEELQAEIDRRRDAEEELEESGSVSAQSAE